MMQTTPDASATTGTSAVATTMSSPARIAPIQLSRSVYNQFQRYLIEAAEQLKNFHAEITDFAETYNLKEIADRRPDTMLGEVLNKIFIKNVDHSGAIFDVPFASVQYFTTTLDRFSKYSAYPQKMDQIYEVFALVKSRIVCRKIAMEMHTPLSTDLYPLINEYLGTAAEEFLSEEERTAKGTPYLRDWTNRHFELSKKICAFLMSSVPPLMGDIVAAVKCAVLETNFEKHTKKMQAALENCEKNSKETQTELEEKS